MPAPIGKGPLIPFHFVGKESDRVRGGREQGCQAQQIAAKCGSLLPALAQDRVDGGDEMAHEARGS